jgi:hypothetical protein
VPSWAEQDPTVDGAPATPPTNQPILEPRRNVGVRRALRDFMKTGDDRSARKALGRYSRGSMGGGSAAAQRLTRAARAGGLAFAALNAAANGQAPIPGTMDLRSLAGRSITEAIGEIVDTFCPPGILDEDAIRASMAEALANALSGLDTFDPQAIDDYAALVATRAFVAELVFNAVMAEQGQSASEEAPVVAVDRENKIRDIVREVADVKATPLLQQNATLSPSDIEGMVKDLATAVYQELAQWR